MRGYVSFLLVLACLAIFAVLAGAHSNSREVNFSNPIAQERMEQLSLEEKRGMLAAAKYGAIAGFSEYVGEVLASEGKEALDPEKAKERAQEGAIAAMALLAPQGQDYETSLWCGNIDSEYQLGALADSSLREERAETCPGCRPLALCKDYVDVEAILDLQKGEFTLAKVGLGSRNVGGSPKIFGMTIYSAKFNMSKVGYVPAGEPALESPYTLQLEGAG